MEKTHIWMDVDTGVDDAVALLCAINEDSVILEGVSAVAGNQTIDKTFKNTRDVLSLGGKDDIKVFKGKDKPLFIELHTAEYFHGKNGLGDAIIDESKAPIEKEDAIDALYKKAKELKGELNIVAVGPLTNIASLLCRYPDVKDYIKTLSIMGGSISNGNITPYAEFNIYVDPHAAKIVFESGLDIVMCGLDVTQLAVLYPKDCDEIGGFGTKCAKLFRESIVIPMRNRETKDKKEGVLMHDSCALYYLIHPDWFKYEKKHIDVVIDGEKIGQTIVDPNKESNAKVVLNVNAEVFINRIKEIYLHKLP